MCSPRDRTRRIASPFLIALAALAAEAQHYAILPVPGAPHDVRTMMQDSKSALWLGTVDDVYRFDGVRSYSIRQYGFPKEAAMSLAEDSEGGIWIATDRIDAKEGAVRGGLYRYRSGHVERMLSRGVESVVSAGDGTVLATISRTAPWEFGDLYIFRRSAAGWHGTPVLLDDAKWLSVDHQGAVLFPCRKGWCELSASQIAHWPQEQLQPRVHGSTGQVDTIRLLRDRFACVWFRSARELSYQCPGGTQVKLPDTEVTPDLAVQLGEAPDGSVLSGGTNVLLGRPGKMRVAGLGRPDSPTAVLAAMDGSIYLCGHWLYRWVYPLALEYWDQNDGVDGPNSLTRIGDQLYLLQAGIRVLNATRQKWVPWVDRSQSGIVQSMLAGTGDTLYAASEVRGVTQLSRSGQVIARSEEHLDSVKLARDGRGTMWVAGTGIRKVVSAGHRLRLISQGLDDGRAEDMAYDRQRGLLWSCYGHEVVVQANGQWAHIGAKDGLVNDDCRSVALVPNGDVWVGYASNTRVSRIRRAVPGKLQVDTFQAKNQSRPLGTAFLRADTRSWLWRAAEAGIYVATQEGASTGDWLPVFPVSDAEEFPIEASAPNSGFIDEDGSVWYAAGNRVSHFSPTRDFATVFPKPAVFIAGMTVGSQAPTLAEAVSQVQVGADVTANVGSLQFDRRGAIHLRYRLLPEQSSWTDTNSFDLALGKPRLGGHTLQVQARLATGPWSPVEEQTFMVELPAWLSWPLLLLYGTAGTGIGTGAASWRKRRRFERELALPDLSAWRMSALAPEAERLLGTRIDGRYEIGHILSVGGFATVVRARDLGNGGQLCAVKIFRYEFGDRAWIRHRFEQEISALKQALHPNIVRITGHGTIETGAPYLVMEFLHGRTLRELLNQGALPRSQVALFLRQIASALDALHRRAIYHRDLKPENLMVRADAEGRLEIVVIDFSIAIVKSRDQTFHGISRVAGTLEYMAPEQVIGFADASTDIYALTKILMEMLTGQRWGDLFQEATLDLPERVREYLESNAAMLSADSIRHIVSAIAFDPVGRPKDILEFVRPIVLDLEQFP